MGDYKIAAVCLNGHCSDSGLHSIVGEENYCNKCGAKIITTCPSCNVPIRGKYISTGFVDFTPYQVPAYCQSCGKPFPWTESALESVALLVREDENLPIDQQDNLVTVLSDIITETPKTSLAVTRFKKAVLTAGKFTAEGLRQFAIDFGCELAKKQLGL